MTNLTPYNLFVDIETTGYAPPEAVPLEIAMVFDWGNPAEPALPALEITVLPTEAEWKRASPKSLEVNGMTWETLKAKGIPREEAVLEIERWLFCSPVDKATTQYVGQNAAFDLRFLRWMMGDPRLDWLGFPGIFPPPVDTIQMAKTLAEMDPTIRFPSFKGHDIARTLGVREEGQVHTALEGAWAVRRTYYALAARMKQVEEALAIKVERMEKEKIA